MFHFDLDTPSSNVKYFELPTTTFIYVITVRPYFCSSCDSFKSRSLYQIERQHTKLKKKNI